MVYLFQLKRLNKLRSEIPFAEIYVLHKLLMATRESIVPVYKIREYGAKAMCLRCM